MELSLNIEVFPKQLFSNEIIAVGKQYTGKSMVSEFEHKLVSITLRDSDTVSQFGK